MKRFTILLIFTLLIGLRPAFTQNIKVLIYDPSGDYGTYLDSSFQQMFSSYLQITSTLPSQLNDYKALFLMMQGKSQTHSLTNDEGNLLINYLKSGGNIFISTFFDTGVDSVAFWNFIGVKFFASLPTVDNVDSLVGTDSTFTKGLVIPVKFQYGGIPVVQGNMIPIIQAKGSPLNFTADYMARSDTFNVILNVISPIYILNSAYLSKVAESFGMIPTLGIKSANLSHLKSFTLHQNYPNPFNPTTQIQYSIPNVADANFASTLVQLKVFDILGRDVATLVNEKQTPGNYKVQFNAGNLPSGVYLYRLTYGSLNKVRKMILVK